MQEQPQQRPRSESDASLGCSDIRDVLGEWELRCAVCVCVCIYIYIYINYVCVCDVLGEWELRRAAAPLCARPHPPRRAS